MNQLLPVFDFQHVVVMPWTSGLSSYGWSMLMGFFVATACGLIGNYLFFGAWPWWAMRSATACSRDCDRISGGEEPWFAGDVSRRAGGGPCHDHPHRTHPQNRA